MINEKLDAIRLYYTLPGPLSDAGPYTADLAALPGEIDTLVRVLQGLALHIFWAERYGVTLDEARQAEVQIRRVVPKLERLLALDGRPLTEARPPELRLVGNCRDFSQLLAAMLRAHGVAARARCGFGTYFLPGHYEDHWMTEYWRPDEARWVQVDGQLDALQCEALGITFDPLDMPHGQFVLAGAAWQMCRAGQANPDDFGIFEYHGWDFILWNVLRDLLSLNKIEVLPWDSWGSLTTPYADMTPEQVAWVDELAALTLAGDTAFDKVRAAYEQNPGLHIPPAWLLE